MDDQNLPRPSAETIAGLIAGGEVRRLAETVLALHPADIADLLDHLSPEEAVIVFELLPVEVASEVLDETRSRVRGELVEQVDDERLADLLDELPVDDAVDLLEDLPDETADRLLNLMEPEEAQEVRDLLQYEEDSAGRLLTREAAVLRRQWTVAQTFDYLRSLEEAETLHYLYVVDREYRLIGVVPLRRLIIAQPDVSVETIMERDLVTVQVTADQEELAEIVSKYDFVSIPVVDADNRFVGIVTVDDVLDVVAEETTEDFQRLGGSEPLSQPYFALSALQIVRKRIVWLLLLFTASVLTDAVITGFNAVILAAASLTIFMPAVSGTGGNAGSQTSATVIRALAVGEVRFSDLMRVLRREFVVGLLMGLVLGGVGYLRATVLGVDARVALVLTLTLPLVLTWATCVSTVVPLLASRLRIDPTVVSSPMIATLVDATGLFIYFSLARMILGL